MRAKNYLRDKVIAETLASDPAAVFYESKTPCRARGHIGLRYISTHACKICADERRQEVKSALAAIRSAKPNSRRTLFGRGR